MGGRGEEEEGRGLKGKKRKKRKELMSKLEIKAWISRQINKK